MAMKEFVHLHNHSDYSLLRSSSTVSGLTKRAKDLAMPGIALTDDGNMFGAREFYRSAKRYSINPIIGCDFYLALSSRHLKTKSETGRQHRRLLLLAKDNAGYENLMKLSSLGYTEGFYYKPRIDKEILQNHSAGLVALSGGMSGEIPRLLSGNRRQEAREAIDFYSQIFGQGNFYLEIGDHGIAEEKQINEELVKLAKEMGLPLVATNESYYVHKEDAYAHEILLCIGNKAKLGDPGRFRFTTEEFYLRSAEEMEALFGHIPNALSNTLRINEQCNVLLEDSEIHLPEYEIPQGYANPDDYLRSLSAQGLAERYPNITRELQERLNFELDIIISMKYTGYFLIVWDFIRYARERNIPVGPGRGSGAGSIVAYCLKITDIDPIQYGLLFERFLNPERISMPDFDIDFCFERRGEVIDYVSEKYGTDRVAQIITFGTLKPRAVIRDVARVYDIPYEKADRIAKLIPEKPKTTIESALEEKDSALKALCASDSQVQDIINIGLKLQNLHRHASTHAAGIVIAQNELTRYVPLFRDPKTGSVSTQYSMDELESCGLIKMDFLGLKTLTIIQKVQDSLLERGIQVDAATLPLNDKKSFNLLGKGRSLAIFQFESQGMQKILIKAKPSRVEDLIALNALYRPGPMENIDTFIRGKHKPRSIKHIHPLLIPLLEETYGVIVYQEQVMETVQLIAGFSLGKADILRRAMGKKKEAEMAKVRSEYMAGAKAKGIAEHTASDIFDILRPFAGYGFNKSHAAAYAVLAYHTAYLKAHYPATFMAANLSNEVDHPDKFSEYLGEAESMGIRIARPDINISAKYFSARESDWGRAQIAQTGGQAREQGQSAQRAEQAQSEQNASAQGGQASSPDPQGAEIRYGFLGIRGLGASVADEILAQRSRPYTSVEDFLERVDLRIINKRVVEILIQSGTMDSICRSRKRVLENIDSIMRSAGLAKAEKGVGQSGLFDMSHDTQAEKQEMEHFDDYPILTRLGWEREFTGRYFSASPLDEFKREWVEYTNIDLSQLEGYDRAQQYCVVALMSDLREFTTKKNESMAGGQLEDYKGRIPFVLFPKSYAANAPMLAEQTVVRCKGRLKKKGESLQFVVEKIALPRGAKQAGRAEQADRQRRAGEELGNSPQSTHGLAGNRPQNKRQLGEEPENRPQHLQAGKNQSQNQGQSQPIHQQGTKAAPNARRAIHIGIGEEFSENALLEIRKVIHTTPGDCPVLIHIPIDGSERIIRCSQTLRSDAQVIEELIGSNLIQRGWQGEPLS